MTLTNDPLMNNFTIGNLRLRPLLGGLPGGEAGGAV